MTFQQIKAVRKPAKDLYQAYPCPPDATRAAEEPLTLRECHLHPSITLNGRQVSYAVAYCRAAVDDIFDHKHGAVMLDHERTQVAKDWVATYADWTVADVKLFVSLLMHAQLPTFNASGREVTGFVTVDAHGFFDKLAAYARRRPHRILQPPAASAPTRLHCWQRDPFYKSHDLHGQPMPPGWDYQSYWSSYPTPEDLAPLFARHRPAPHP